MVLLVQFSTGRPTSNIMQRQPSVSHQSRPPQALSRQTNRPTSTRWPSTLTRHLGLTNRRPTSANGTSEQRVYDQIADFLEDSKPNDFQPEHLISFQQVKQICEELDITKAIGPDDIHPLFLKEGGDLLYRCIYVLFNFSIRWSVLPQEWKKALIVPILKPGQNASLPSSYRPIALTCSICKCIEIILLIRLNKFWHRLYSANIPFRSKQAGFTEGAGTEYQLHRVRLAQLEALKKDVHRPFVFLDISKAFDRVWHPSLIAQLIANLFPRYLIHWIAAFLTERMICVVYAGLQSQWFPINAGVPQGAVLSPFLFIVFIDEITNQIDVALALFADDIAAWSKSLDTRTAVDDLNQLLASLTDWAERNKVIFSPTKSVVLNVGSSFSKVDIKLGDSVLECVRDFKYLGVVFSYDGSWDAHIKHVVKRCFLVRNQISYSSAQYFTRLSSIPFLINTCIIPIITYGWPVWKPESFTTLKNLFLSILRHFCRLSRTTYIKGMLEALGLPDLEALHHLSVMRSRARLLLFPREHVAGRILTDRAYSHHLAFPRQVAATMRVASSIIRKDPDKCSDQELISALSSSALNPIPLSLKLDHIQIASTRARLRLHQTNLRCDLIRRHLLIGSATCPHCQLDEDESTLHLLCRCSLFSVQRASVFTSIRHNAEQLKLTVPCIFSYLPATDPIPTASTLAKLFVFTCTADFAGLDKFLCEYAESQRPPHRSNPKHIFHRCQQPFILQHTNTLLQAILDLLPP